jgi:hypothetical protein
VSATVGVITLLCVYYKVEPAQHAALAPRVRQLQAQLVVQWPGLSAELLQRPQASGGVETWMETYRHTAGLSAAMVAAIAHAAAQAGLPEPRHDEAFIPLR